MAAADNLADYIKEKRGKTGDYDEPPTTAPTLNREGAWAAVGFAVVLIAVGIPVWWRTTTVYRAPLPYTAIQELAHVRRLHFLPITILSHHHGEGSQFSASLDNQLKMIGAVKYHVHSRGLLKDQMVAVRDATDMDALVRGVAESTSLHTATLTIVLLDGDRARQFLGLRHVHVTRLNMIVVAVAADPQMVAEIINTMSLDQPPTTPGMGASALSPTQWKRKPAPLAAHKVISEPSYSLTITLMLPQPHRTVAYWDSKAAVEDYLRPLLRQLEEVHLRVSVRSQQLFMTPLSGIKPTWRPQLGYYAVPHHQLPLAINAIEAKLGSFVSTDPALHFIVYVPGEDQAPLHIHRPDDTPLPSNSFVVPRWGGVMIHNPPASHLLNTSGGVTRFPLDAHAVMTTILTQLQELLPVPYVRPTPLVSVSAPDSPRLAEWQLDAVARARVTQYYDTTSTTLQSLCELVGEISNMVVSEEVGGWVWESVEEWEACGEATQEGRLQEASQYCTNAHKHAHSAFFHPSMLALLYFPDNQKYAIYVPLFLPVSIPVLLSCKMLYALLRSYWGKRTGKAKTS